MSVRLMRLSVSFTRTGFRFAWKCSENQKRAGALRSEDKSNTKGWLVFRVGLGQLLAYGSTYYLPAILAAPVGRDFGLSPAWTFGGLSLALVISGLMGPRVGAYVDRHGGRAPLAAATLVFAAGLGLLGAASNIAIMALGWIIVGLGMGLGYYETAFAALAKISGAAARGQIVGVTLVAGFASFISWPLTAWIEAHWGWRVCFYAWALVNLVAALPLALSVPAVATTTAAASVRAQSPHRLPDHLHSRAMLALGVMFAATSFVAGGLSSTLPAILTHLSMSPTAAIFAASFVGPAQAAGRLAEMLWLGRLHPLHSAKLATSFLPAGVAVFLLGGPAMAPVFASLFGVGNGLLTIARGALPLALFGPDGYGARVGLLAAPGRFIGALSPFLMGLLVDWLGAGALSAAALLNILGLGALIAIRR
jgi:predicted MFS family arabinose efflux permease